MYKFLFIIFVVIIIYSCNETPEEHERRRFIERQTKVNNKKNGEWKNDLIRYYISHCNNELIIASRKDSTIKLQRLFDRIENTDSSKYMVFQIGHDVSETGGGMPRFVTDGWVYIDSAKRVLYEYDIANERLRR